MSLEINWKKALRALHNTGAAGDLRNIRDVEEMLRPLVDAIPFFDNDPQHFRAKAKNLHQLLLRIAEISPAMRDELAKYNLSAEKIDFQNQVNLQNLRRVLDFVARMRQQRQSRLHQDLKDAMHAFHNKAAEETQNYLNDIKDSLVADAENRQANSAYHSIEGKMSQERYGPGAIGLILAEMELIEQANFINANFPNVKPMDPSITGADNNAWVKQNMEQLGLNRGGQEVFAPGAPAPAAPAAPIPGAPRL